jgi:hypothetical protein
VKTKEDKRNVFSFVVGNHTHVGRLGSKQGEHGGGDVKRLLTSLNSQSQLPVN